MPSKYAYNLGATRGKGSSTRKYTYCLQTTSNQFSCIQQFITINQPSIPPVTTPSAPTITSITSGLTQLTVNFTAPTSTGGSPITNYQYSTNNGTSFTSAGTTSSPITITGLVTGTTYQVIIRAVNSIGNGNNSNMVSSIPSTTASAPTITSITPGSTQLTVNFTAPSNNGGSPITDYQYSTDNGTSFTNAGRITSPITITGLTNGTTYQVIIRAVNSAGNGINSTMVASTTLNIPSAPTITSIIPGSSQLTVNFTAPTSDGGSPITDYQYSRDNGNSFTNAGRTTSPITITGLTNGTAYPVIIRAVNSVGNGINSNTVTATPATTPSAPEITIITPGAGQLTVNFTAPTSNGGSSITDYQYSTDNGTSFTNAGRTTSPITIDQLTNGTSYSVIIRAVNSVGNGINSNTVSATPVTTPSAPTITSITSGLTQLTVNFTDPTSDGGSSITDYEYSTDNGTSFTSAVTTTSPITITGLVTGTPYQVIIRAVNSLGYGENSNMVTATPATTPSAPTITSITPDTGPGTGKLVVNFTAPTSTGGSPITNYQYSTDNGTSFTSVTPVTTTSPITITGLVGGREYSVIIRAVNSSGNGDNSNMVKGTPVYQLSVFSFGNGTTFSDDLDSIGPTSYPQTSPLVSASIGTRCGILSDQAFNSTLLTTIIIPVTVFSIGNSVFGGITVFTITFNDPRTISNNLAETETFDVFFRTTVTQATFYNTANWTALNTDSPKVSAYFTLERAAAQNITYIFNAGPPP